LSGFSADRLLLDQQQSAPAVQGLDPYFLQLMEIVSGRCRRHIGRRLGRVAGSVGNILGGIIWPALAFALDFVLFFAFFRKLFLALFVGIIGSCHCMLS
jgi:hypothetical protein